MGTDATNRFVGEGFQSHRHSARAKHKLRSLAVGRVASRDGGQDLLFRHVALLGSSRVTPNAVRLTFGAVDAPTPVYFARACDAEDRQHADVGVRLSTRKHRNRNDAETLRIPCNTRER